MEDNELDLRLVEAHLPEFNPSVKKVGLYGGSFNPPHMGHVFMCLITLQTQDLDEVWVIPAGDHPVKSNLMSFQHRVQMCKRAFGRLAAVEISTVESVLPKPTYTVNTISSVQRARPDLDLYYIIGGDIVEDIPNWQNAGGLTDMAQLIVVPRQGHPIVDPPPELGDFIKVEVGFDLPALSSSHLHKMLERDADISGFVDRDVYEQIHKWQIYMDTGGHNGD